MRDQGAELPIFSCALLMPRPDKTEMEFFLLMMLLVVPFGYFVIRTVLALVGL